MIYHAVLTHFLHLATMRIKSTSTQQQASYTVPTNFCQPDSIPVPPSSGRLEETSTCLPGMLLSRAAVGGVVIETRETVVSILIRDQMLVMRVSAEDSFSRTVPGRMHCQQVT